MFSGSSFGPPVGWRRLGADLVGMSTAEVIAANHMGIRSAGSPVERLPGLKQAHQEVLDTMKGSSESLCRLIFAFLRELR